MRDELQASSPPSTRRDDIRMKLQRIRRARRSGMFGPAELLALAGSAVILLSVLLSYFYFLLPARSNLQTQQSERSRLQNQLRSSQELRLQEQDTQTTVD